MHNTRDFAGDTIIAYSRVYHVYKRWGNDAYRLHFDITLMWLCCDGNGWKLMQRKRGDQIGGG